MTIFRMVLDAVNVLVPLLTAWDGAHVRLFIVAHPISVTVPETTTTTTKTKLVSFKLTNQPRTRVTYLTPYFMMNSELNSSVVHESLLSSDSVSTGSSSLMASLPVGVPLRLLDDNEYVWCLMASFRFSVPPPPLPTLLGVVAPPGVVTVAGNGLVGAGGLGDCTCVDCKLCSLDSFCRRAASVMNRST